MADDDEWLKRYHAAQERQRRHSERLAEYLAPALRFLGVTAVIVEFDGYGDSGEVQAPVFEWREEIESEGEPDDLPEGLIGFVERACRRALPSGWDDSAGSWGEWVIDAEEGTSELVLYWRDEEPEDEE